MILAVVLATLIAIPVLALVTFVQLLYVESLRLRTRDLPSVTRQADILVVAIGRAGLIRSNHIKPGATVIDVGMNQVADEAVARSLFGDDLERRLQIIAKRGYTLVGDVNAAEADEIAGRRTPVPGGVGLLTVAMLMSNTLKAARLRRGLQDDK